MRKGYGRIVSLLRRVMGASLPQLGKKFGRYISGTMNYEIFSGPEKRYQNRTVNEKKGKIGDMEEKQLSVETIQGAIAGKPDAVQKVIDHYSAYIDDLCTIEEQQRDGTMKKVLDEDMRQHVILKLIEALPEFDL